MPQINHRTWINLLALLVILALLASLGARVWLESERAQLAGPSLLSSNAQGQIAVLVGDDVWLIDRGGRQAGKMELPGQDIGRIVALTYDPQDNLYIGAHSGWIYRCAPATTRCRLFNHQQLPDDRYKFTWDARRNLLIVAATRRILLALDADGREVARLAPADSPLNYPNGLVVDDKGRLIVTDSNNHRLVMMAITATAFGAVTRETVLTQQTGPRGNTWPTDIARDSRGQLWVLSEDALFNEGEVLRFDAEGQFLNAVPLPADWAAEGLCAHPDGLVISSEQAFDLLLVDTDGNSVQPFGEPVLRDIFLDMRQRITRLETLSSLLWGVTGLLLLLVIALAIVDYRLRQSGLPPASDSAPLQDQPAPSEDFLLHPDPALQRNLRLSLFALAAMTALLAVMLYSVFRDSDMPLGIFAGIIAMPAMLIGALGYMLAGLARMRIGMLNGQLRLVDYQGREIIGNPADAVHTARFIALHEHVVQLGNDRTPFFDRDYLKQHLAPHLDSNRRLTGMKAELYLLRIRYRPALLLWLVVVVMAVLAVYLKLNE